MHACHGKGFSRAAENLLKAGADVNSADEFGATPLMMAAANIDCKLELIETLMSFGADINRQTDKEKNTALMLAILNFPSENPSEENYKLIRRLLLEKSKKPYFKSIRPWFFFFFFWILFKSN